MVKWAAAPAAPPSPAPADADHDGVPDTLDKCPGTPAGALVDAQGCPKVITEAIRQEVKVLFDNGKADIKPQYRDEVSKVAELARAYPTAHIEIQGYTDNTGRPAKNVALSQARAEAVRDSLVHDFGVDASRLTAKGFGAAKPLADNKTADGRASNRRVVAVISGERKQVEMKKNRHH
jgi:OOP family OmpA-OmpF porin